MATLTSEDEGKILVDVEGEELGVVTEVESNTAWVDPDPGLGEAVLAALGWSEKDEDDYTVDGDLVDTVTEGEVRVNADL
ncbi:hypothetical protein J2752_000999 [Halarchaeum rubridurum]|uniref:PRC-barrel domain-containing protein n=1 Tax=Halarchaeum rubridurum TaxID=489911 RepID=A0A830FT64_9EURY|nr:hypothetical protein [Halarchaeum rubridurum]MBP1954118.1 hypothetical protein [Halarchaeum rubridurum]GGM57471.1 hypothetical protein GCM10009017_04560 [Halarchaeum rubridurum]